MPNHVEPAPATAGPPLRGAALPPPVPLFPPLTLPRLAQGSCVWGTAGSVPPLSRLAQQVQAGLGISDTFMQTVPPQARLFFAPQNVQSKETMLQSARQRQPTPPGNFLRFATEAYADLKLVEADLCANATGPGSPQDLAAATTPRQRMLDLSTELLQVPGYMRQCP